MPRLTGRLEQAGLVTRVRCEADRRVVYVRITEAGLAMLDELEPAVNALHRSQFKGLSGEEMRVLSRLLERSACGADGEQPD